MSAVPHAACVLRVCCVLCVCSVCAACCMCAVYVLCVCVCVLCVLQVCDREMLNLSSSGTTIAWCQLRAEIWCNLWAEIFNCNSVDWLSELWSANLTLRMLRSAVCSCDLWWDHTHVIAYVTKLIGKSETKLIIPSQLLNSWPNSLHPFVSFIAVSWHHFLPLGHCLMPQSLDNHPILHIGRADIHMTGPHRSVPYFPSPLVVL